MDVALNSWQKLTCQNIPLTCQWKVTWLRGSWPLPQITEISLRVTPNWLNCFLIRMFSHTVAEWQWTVVECSCHNQILIALTCRTMLPVFDSIWTNASFIFYQIFSFIQSSTHFLREVGLGYTLGRESKYLVTNLLMQNKSRINIVATWDNRCVKIH